MRYLYNLKTGPQNCDIQRLTDNVKKIPACSAQNPHNKGNLKSNLEILEGYLIILINVYDQ